MPTLILKPRAILMAKDAYIWYETQRFGLGEEFLDELESAYQTIEINP